MDIKYDTILIASKNKGKIKEFENMFKNFDINIKTLYDYDISQVEETGESFFENALIKAKAGYKASKLPTIADDSGLEVEALNWQPGIYSARFGKDYFSDDDRLWYLLGKLKGIKNRKARFKTSLVFYSGENQIYEFEGVWEGVILENPIGNNGFGYDPVFYDENLKLSAAQLTPNEKKEVSHRGKAMKLFFEKFKSMI
jgi:XTP/dITP diphosphohydrolase